MRKLLLIHSVVGMLLALVSTANATIIWGVTGTANMNQASARAEVFTIDTTTWTVTKLHTTTQNCCGKGRNYSDIAVTPSGRVYCVGSDYKGGGSYFKDFFQLDPATGQVTNVWHGINPRGEEMNALTALDDKTLLAVEGGYYGMQPYLIKIELDDSGNFVQATNLGRIDGCSAKSSGGDIVCKPDGSGFLAALGNGDDFYQIDPQDPASASKLVTIDRSSIAGLAYDFDAVVGSSPYDFEGAVSPALLGGVFTNERAIYNINLTTGITTHVFDLSGQIKWNIFGLDSVPEPTTALFLTLGAVIIRIKRK